MALTLLPPNKKKHAPNARNIRGPIAVLRNDNLVPMMPSLIFSDFSKTSGGRTYVEVPGQKTPMRFYASGMTASFLCNSEKMAWVYVSMALTLGTLYLINVRTRFQIFKGRSTLMDAFLIIL